MKRIDYVLLMNYLQVRQRYAVGGLWLCLFGHFGDVAAVWVYAQLLLSAALLAAHAGKLDVIHHLISKHSLDVTVKALTESVRGTC